MTNSIPLVLGGHSFISQLGNDPALSPAAQVELVRACLDNGIRWFDTTYQPERVALGHALSALGRRDEATVLAWNFFVDFGHGGEVGGPDYYQPHHLDLMLRQLQTDTLDCLVVHPLRDEERNRQQLELAVAWRDQGRVKRLGLWHPGADAATVYNRDNPYSFMVRPYNVTTRDAAPAFAAARALGWETLACSPFVRGWELDRLVDRAVQMEPGLPAAEARTRLADLMLRYSLYQPNVDRLIVSIRDVAWVACNVASVRRGPLSESEAAWLQQISAG